MFLRAEHSQSPQQCPKHNYPNHYFAALPIKVVSFTEFSLKCYGVYVILEIIINKVRVYLSLFKFLK